MPTHRVVGCVDLWLRIAVAFAERSSRLSHHILLYHGLQIKRRPSNNKKNDDDDDTLGSVVFLTEFFLVVGRACTWSYWVLPSYGLVLCGFT